MKKYLIFLIISFTSLIMTAQDDNVVERSETIIKTDSINSADSTIWSLDGGLDLFTTWIWRGQKMHNGPDMQPYINFTVGDFSIGTVGVVSWPTSNSIYYETDIYAFYDFGFIIPVVTDYWIALNDSVNYFDWSSPNTGHFVEVGLIVPIKNFTLAGYTFVYGADKDEDGNNYYSTYIEASYQFKHGISVLVGGTIGKGFYKQGDYTKDLDLNEDGFAIVNIGLNKRFNIKKTPIDTYLYVNPEASRVYVTAVVRLFENNF